MTKRDREQRWLWTLPELGSDAAGRWIADDRLRAYRAGELHPEERRRIEWALARSAANRARLVELSGLRLPQPSERTRERVLRGEPARPSASGFKWWRLAAAFATASLAVPLTWLLLRTSPQPLPSAFDVRLEGLADVRSSGGSAAATAGSRVRVTIEPRAAAVAGLEFGLYRRTGAGWERVDESTMDEVSVERGAAAFRVVAAELVGTVPGTHPVLVAVARRGRLPDRLQTPPGADPASAMESASGGKAYTRMLTLLPGGKDPP